MMPVQDTSRIQMNLHLRVAILEITVIKTSQEKSKGGAGFAE